MGAGQSKVRAGYSIVVPSCPICGQTHYYAPGAENSTQHCRATAPSRQTAFSLVPVAPSSRWKEPSVSESRYQPLYPSGTELKVFHGFKYTPSAILSFYYENRRSSAERVIDQFLGMGQDGRQIFSNLYPSTIRLKSNREADNDIFLFPQLADVEFASVENLFQASKCSVEGDAKFIALDLPPHQAASYGQARLTLTAEQRQKLIDYGILFSTPNVIE